jgi:N-acetylmuramoyl-L-alanine amidase
MIAAKSSGRRRRPARRRRFGCRLLLMLLAVVPIGRPGTMAAAEKPAVVLDAGHGGMDTGARSDEGGLEKTIVLAMVTQLNKDLANQWRVVLTRDGDYRLTASERAGTANRAHGDVFLSIHTGGGFSRQTSGVTVFTSEAASSSPTVSTGAATTPGREADDWPIYCNTI